MSNRSHMTSEISLSLAHTEQWCVFELDLPDLPCESAESDATPFSEWKMVFTKGDRTIETDPFLDGYGAWKVRFMPDEVGEWRYELLSGFGTTVEPLLPDRGGTLICTAPAEGNHGLVRVIDERQFAYADGLSYIPLGTTCQRGWEQELLERTLSALAASPFTKVRFYVNTVSADFEALEKSIQRLLELGMEAELLLQCKDNSTETRNAVRQAVARLSAFRNVWWSLEVPEDRQDLKEELLQLVHSCDSYSHLLTLFGSNPLSSYGDRRMTHVSLQAADASQTSYYTKLHRKPVILDECGCEGNGPSLWGSLPGEELIHRMWESLCRGGYAGHGEMLLRSDGRSWHTHGEELSGAALPRIAFLRGLLHDAPSGLQYMPEFYDAATIGLDGQYYLQYFGIHRYPSKSVYLPEGRYMVEVIDTWNMTIQPLPDEYDEKLDIVLPARLWHALRIRRTDDGSGFVPIPTLKDADAIRRRAEDNDNFI